MSRARRPSFRSVCLLALTLFIPTATAYAQDPVRLGPYVVDVRGAIPLYGQDPFVAGQRGLKSLQLPPRGLGLDVGVHVYPLRWRAITFGVGVEALLSGGERSPKIEEVALIANEATGNPLTPIQTRFHCVTPQLSFNFGGTNGWSYLSGGLGKSTFSVAPDGVDDRRPRRFSTVNYGGGGRWFAKDHLAFSLDLRFYSIPPQEETDELPGLPRMTLMVFSVGVSFK